MTALDKYIRLEALGLWREEPGAEPREVVVSFGVATLLLTDVEENPLGHWALAGVQAVRRDGGATVYAMMPEGGETLTIRDSDMVEAIAAVARAYADRPPAERPRPRRRPVIPLLLALVLLAFGAAALPRLIAAQAARMVPPEVAEELGDRMLLGLMETRGAPCAGTEGRRALGRLAAELDPAAPPRLRVLDLGGAPAVALPGRTVLIDRTALARAAGADEIAGWAAAALAGDPVEGMMRAAGPVAGLRYVFTGALGEPALARATAAAVAPAGDAPVFHPAAGMSSPRGERDWQALQAICG